MEKQKARKAEFQVVLTKLDPEKIRRTTQPGQVRIPRTVLYHRALGPCEKLVAMWLYDHCEPKNYTARGWSVLIAADLSLNPSTVTRAIKSLRALKVIRGVKKAWNAHNVAYNIYTLHSDLYEVLPEPKEGKKVKERPADIQLAKEKGKKKSGQLGFQYGADNKSGKVCIVCNGTKIQFDPFRKQSRPCPECKPKPVIACK